jgi:hypothetical protein
MEVGQFIRSASELPNLLPKVTHVYVGSEVCSRALPPIVDIYGLWHRILDRGCIPVVVTPLIQEDEMAHVENWLSAILERFPHGELIVNDMGLAEWIANSYVNTTVGAGRILYRNLCRPVCQKLIDRFNLKRLECDDLQHLCEIAHLQLQRSFYAGSILRSIAVVCPFVETLCDFDHDDQPCVRSYVGLKSPDLAYEVALRGKGVYAIKEYLQDSETLWGIDRVVFSPAA